MEKENKYVEYTRKMLNKIEDERIASQGFQINTSNKETKYILCMGINPAGNAIHANIEKQNENYIFLGHIPNVKIENYVNNKFYGSIYNMFRDILGDENMIKWNWCNMTKSELDNFFNQNKDLNNGEKKAINDFYVEHKDAKYTIVMGEFFYYHQTEQEKLKFNDENIKKYMKEILNLHIKEFEDNNLNLDLIWINNAHASQKLLYSLGKNNDITQFKYKGEGLQKEYTIICSGMISGRMDNFSKIRLKNEIKEALKNA